MNIKDISKEIHQIARDKGFYDNGERNIGEMLMLVVSELSEALEADRKGRKLGPLDTTVLPVEYLNTTLVGEFDTDIEKLPNEYERLVKGSFEEEIADAVIRLFDLAEYLKIDLEWYIRAKVNYNKQREYKHGKRY